MSNPLKIIGGGIAGSEAAWQAAELGISVILYEMRPYKNTPAHVSDQLAELVCSNSLGSVQATKAPGLLKSEMKGLGSLILSCAEASSVPAGSSLAVDRDLFARITTERIELHPNITLIREEVRAVPTGPCIVATGPLTSPALAAEISKISGQEYLYFYDAVSPIVSRDSIDMTIAFRGSRYDYGVEAEGDYINCPLSEVEYIEFCKELKAAEQITLREFEKEDKQFFESCLPVEVIAQRSIDGLRFGPMRPVGLTNPHTGEKPFAVVQLRQDDLANTLYNLVGFQTNLRWGEQRRILRMIPGLKEAEFMRYGMMHRNTYINSPTMLNPTLQTRARADLFFAGQIIGAEGYMGNAAMGLVAGINAARFMNGQHPLIFPIMSMIGALCHYVTHAEVRSFQPMKPNYGLLPLPQERMKKDDRYRYYRERALKSLRRFTRGNSLEYQPDLADQDISLEGNYKEDVRLPLRREGSAA